MNLLFTICGRAVSKGFRNKNLKELNGVPLVYYTLAAIRLFMEAHPEHQVYVALNTDSKELTELVRSQGAVRDVFVAVREPELADDVTPKVDVIRDTFLQFCEKESGTDLIVDLDITSPLRRVCDIEETINQAVGDPNCDLAFSVVEARRNPYFNMVQETDGYYKKVCPSIYTARQQTPAVYELNASIYAYKPVFLNSALEKTILDYNCRVAVMPDYLVLDIDSERDFETMEMIAAFFEKRDCGLAEVILEAKGIKKDSVRDACYWK